VSETEKKEYELKDVLRTDRPIVFNGKQYKMRYFSVGDQIYFEGQYDRLEFFKKVANCETKILSEIAYQLMAYTDEGKETEFYKDYPSMRIFQYKLPARLSKESQELENAVIATMHGDVFAQTIKESEQVLAGADKTFWEKAPVGRGNSFIKSILAFIGLGNKKVKSASIQDKNRKNK
jgi:hypothetical protein